MRNPMAEYSPRTAWWKLLLQWVVALALIGFLLAQISLQMLVDLFARVNLTGVLLGVVVYLITNVIRAWRVAWICNRPFRDILPLMTPTLAFSFGNNVLPARAGEPIFVWAAVATSIIALTATQLIMKALSAAVSHRGTLWNAAVLITTSGETAVITCRTDSRLPMSSSARDGAWISWPGLLWIRSPPSWPVVPMRSIFMGLTFQTRHRTGLFQR